MRTVSRPIYLPSEALGALPDDYFSDLSGGVHTDTAYKCVSWCILCTIKPVTQQDKAATQDNISTLVWVGGKMGCNTLEVYFIPLTSWGQRRGRNIARTLNLITYITSHEIALLFENLSGCEKCVFMVLRHSAHELHESNHFLWVIRHSVWGQAAWLLSAWRFPKKYHSRQPQMWTQYNSQPTSAQKCYFFIFFSPPKWYT